MLRSYQAELSGTELVWLEAPPLPMRRRRVLVVVEDTSAANDAPSDPAGKAEFSDLVGKLQWQGDAVAAQRGLRDEW